MGQPPDVKRAALVAQLKQYPLARSSGGVKYLLTDELIRSREAFGTPTFEEAVAMLPICEGCGEHIIVGEEGLIEGKYCASCAHKHAA